MAYIGKAPFGNAVRTRFFYTASGGETSLSGADSNGKTLAFTDGNYVDVYLNGVLLITGTDYNTSTENTIAGLSALAAGDNVEIVVYETFSLFNSTFNGNVTINEDLTVDTNTLYVDSTNNRVGIGTSSPATALDVNGTVTADGGAFTGDVTFGDNNKAIFGAGSDLQIYHDGSNSNIFENGTGSLTLQTNGAKIGLAKASPFEWMVEANVDGAVNLYYDSAAKLATTSTGIDVTGTVTADGLTVDGEAGIEIYNASGGGDALNFRPSLGSSNKYNLSITSYDHSGGGVGPADGLSINGFDGVSISTGSSTGRIERLRVAQNGDISFYEDTGTTAKLFWDASAESLGIGTSSPLGLLEVKAAGFVASHISGDSTSETQLRFNTNTAARVSNQANTSLIFDTNATERMRIDSSGNVGIGTTSPADKLHIEGNIYLGASSRTIYTGGSANLIFQNNTGNMIFVRSNGSSESMRITSSGNVGIGTTAPVSPLEIATTNKLGSTFTGTTNGEGLTVTQTNYTAGNYISLVEAAYDDSNDANPNVRIGAMFDGNGSNLAFGTSNSYGSGITNTAMFINSSGNVGIGTSSPAANLHVSGSGARKIDITDTGGANTRISTANNNSYVGSTTNHPLLFITNDAERMRITGGGNLNVAAPGSTDIGRLGGSVYSSGERNVYIWAGSGLHYTQVSGRFDADGSPVFQGVVGGTVRSEIEANGDFLSATNSYGSTSDETLKENIVASGSQWDDIKAVQVKKFSYIEDDLDAPNMLGVIAQDLEESGMNGLVKTKTKTRPTEDGEEEVVLDDDGNPVTYKTVKYSVLYMKAIKALQEAITKIEALEAENADFETRLTALEN